MNAHSHIQKTMDEFMTLDIRTREKLYILAIKQFMDHHPEAKFTGVTVNPEFFKRTFVLSELTQTTANGFLSTLLFWLFALKCKTERQLNVAYALTITNISLDYLTSLFPQLPYRNPCSFDLYSGFDRIIHERQTKVNRDKLINFMVDKWKDIGYNTKYCSFCLDRNILCDLQWTLYIVNRTYDMFISKKYTCHRFRKYIVIHSCLTCASYGMYEQTMHELKERIKNENKRIRQTNLRYSLLLQRWLRTKLPTVLTEYLVGFVSMVPKFHIGQSLRSHRQEAIFEFSHNQIIHRYKTILTLQPF